MATVKRIDGPRGPRWIVRYNRPGGAATQKSFRKSGLAQDFALEVEDTKRKGAYVDPSRSRITFADMTDLWRSVQTHEDTTVKARESDLANHVLPAIGAIPLHQLRPLQLQQLQRQLEASFQSADTAKRVWGWVVSILAAAVQDERLSRSPAAGLKLKRAPKRQLEIMQPAQVGDLIGALPEHHRTVAMVAAGAGLRLSEVLGLRPEDVTWLSSEPVIHVRRQLVIPYRGERAYLRLPKGNKERTVPVSRSLVEALSAHMASHPRATVWDSIEGEDRTTVFASPEGRFVAATRIGENVRLARARVGLGASVHFHSLRHFYAATLIAAGLSEREIGLRLGHSSLQVTTTYGGLFQDADQRTRDAVEATAGAWMTKANALG